MSPDHRDNIQMQWTGLIISLVGLMSDQRDGMLVGGWARSSLWSARLSRVPADHVLDQAPETQSEAIRAILLEGGLHLMHGPADHVLDQAPETRPLQRLLGDREGSPLLHPCGPHNPRRSGPFCWRAVHIVATSLRTDRGGTKEMTNICLIYLHAISLVACAVPEDGPHGGTKEMTSPCRTLPRV